VSTACLHGTDKRISMRFGDRTGPQALLRSRSKRRERGGGGDAGRIFSSWIDQSNLVRFPKCSPSQVKWIVRPIGSHSRAAREQDNGSKGRRASATAPFNSQAIKEAARLDFPLCARTPDFLHAMPRSNRAALLYLSQLVAEPTIVRASLVPGDLGRLFPWRPR
jgi:hypothetical protein